MLPASLGVFEARSYCVSPDWPETHKLWVPPRVLLPKCRDYRCGKPSLNHHENNYFSNHCFKALKKSQKNKKQGSKAIILSLQDGNKTVMSQTSTCPVKNRKTRFIVQPIILLRTCQYLATEKYPFEYIHISSFISYQLLCSALFNSAVCWYEFSFNHLSLFPLGYVFKCTLYFIDYPFWYASHLGHFY